MSPTITYASPIEGELFAVKAIVDQVDDRALDTQRQILAGILFIYMTVLVFIISIGTTSLEIVVLWSSRRLVPWCGCHTLTKTLVYNFSTHTSTNQAETN